MAQHAQGGARPQRRDWSSRCGFHMFPRVSDRVPYAAGAEVFQLGHRVNLLVMTLDSLVHRLPSCRGTSSSIWPSNRRQPTWAARTPASSDTRARFRRIFPFLRCERPPKKKKTQNPKNGRLAAPLSLPTAGASVGAATRFLLAVFYVLQLQSSIPDQNPGGRPLDESSTLPGASQKNGRHLFSGPCNALGKIGREDGKVIFFFFWFPPRTQKTSLSCPFPLPVSNPERSI